MQKITEKLIVCIMIIGVFTVPYFSLAQTSDVHQQTSTPQNARFEIVQSELAVRWTFRLDRFTGNVSQLVKTSEGESTWQIMLVESFSPISNPTYPRFQIFTSGLVARCTYLIDSVTGKTWYLVTSTRKEPDGTEYDVHYWVPFAE